MASLDSMALPVPEQSGDIVWAQLPTAANAPSARSGHSFTIVPASRQVRRISAAESDELLLLYAGDHASLGIPINTGCGLCGKSFGVPGGFRAIFVASVTRCWATLFALGGVGSSTLGASDDSLHVKQAYMFGGCGEKANHGTFFNDLHVLKISEGCVWDMVRAPPADCMPRPLRPRPIPCDPLELARQDLSPLQISPKGTPPSPRWGHSCVAVDDSRLWFFGGLNQATPLAVPCWVLV